MAPSDQMGLNFCSVFDKLQNWVNELGQVVGLWGSSLEGSWVVSGWLQETLCGLAGAMHLSSYQSQVAATSDNLYKLWGETIMLSTCKYTKKYKYEVIIKFKGAKEDTADATVFKKCFFALKTKDTNLRSF